MCPGAVLDIAPGITLLFGGACQEAFASRLEYSPASLFPREFRWIDAKCSQGWDGGRRNAPLRLWIHCEDLFTDPF
jgi:hypothetical protein